MNAHRSGENSTVCSFSLTPRMQPSYSQATMSGHEAGVFNHSGHLRETGLTSGPHKIRVEELESDGDLRPRPKYERKPSWQVRGSRWVANGKSRLWPPHTRCVSVPPAFRSAFSLPSQNSDYAQSGGVTRITCSPTVDRHGIHVSPAGANQQSDSLHTDDGSCPQHSIALATCYLPSPSPFSRRAAPSFRVLCAAASSFLHRQCKQNSTSNLG
jgi:hypothetical protein